MASEGNAIGYSLWLVPSDPARSRLATLIERLAGRLGTPRFAPHVTLLGGFDAEPEALLRCAEQLAAETPALALRLGRPAHSERFFRCLYAPVESSPALAQAHARARTAFAFEPAEPFLAHLSLVYAILPAATREALASELAPDLAALVLECRELRLVRTQGRCEEWRTRARFALRASHG